VFTAFGVNEKFCDELVVLDTLTNADAVLNPVADAVTLTVFELPENCTASE
jgi:hypothetical protein